MAEAPAFTEADAGDTETVKLGAATTVRVAEVDTCSAPDVPVTVKASLPVGVFEPTLTVSEECCPLETEEGLKLQVAAVGKLEQVRATLPLKPFCPLTLTV